MAPMKCPARHEPVDVFQDSFSLTHLAQRWNMHRREVRHLLQTGQLPFVQIEKQLRVLRKAALSFEHKHREGGRLESDRP